MSLDLLTYVQFFLMLCGVHVSPFVANLITTYSFIITVYTSPLFSILCGLSPIFQTVA